MHHYIKINVCISCSFWTVEENRTLAAGVKPAVPISLLFQCSDGFCVAHAYLKLDGSLSERPWPEPSVLGRRMLDTKTLGPPI